jgi:hypothetical protein
LVALALCVSAAAQRFTNLPAGWSEQPVQDGQAVLEKFLDGKKMIVATMKVVGTLNTVEPPCSPNGYCHSTQWMDLTYQDSDNNAFVISARCRYLWAGYCDLPVLGDQDEVVIERGKKGKYSVSIALRSGSLDKKGSVSKYEIVDLRHFTK